MNWLKTRFLGYGFLLGTAGVKILSSKEAKKVYTHVTAAALRGKDEIMKQYTKIKENCEDIAAEAKNINDKREVEDRENRIREARALLESLEQ